MAMNLEELQAAYRQAMQEWEDRQNRVNELLELLKVAQSRVKYVSEYLELLRQRIYEAQVERRSHGR